MNVALSSTTRKQRPQIVINLFLAVAFLAVFLFPFAQSFNSNSSNDNSGAPVTNANAGAFGFLCQDGIGFNMQPSNGWGRQFGEIPNEETGGRRFTIQEAFGKSLNFVSYYGEGEGTMLVAAKDEDKAAPDFVSVDEELLEAERTMDSCLFTKITLTMAGSTFWVADAITNVTQAAVSMAFNPELVCDPNSPSNTCLDLLGIIGGDSDNDDESIIGSLTNSLYFPLITIVGAIAGISAAYQGIVKRQTRKAFGALGWIAMIVIIGAMVVSRPTLITKAPMTVSNLAASCVLGAFSGNACDGSSTAGVDTGGEIFNGKSSSELVCNSSSGVSSGMKGVMDSAVGSATCQIWKSFVLNPYAIASFGTSFDKLDTKDPTADGGKFVNAADGVDANDFCVNLSSSRPASSMEGSTLVLNSSGNGGTVCNIAAYQLYLQTNATSGSDRLPSDPMNDERWYRIVEVAGNNPQMWSNWTNSGSSSANKVFYGALAVIISAAGNFIIVVTALWALIFYITGIMLMAFAPIFMLIGIHPGRGRKVMIGWIEQVITSIFKYVLSAAFVVVTVGIYAGILAANSNLFTNLIFVLIVTVALFIYRREFIEMLGKAEMGGQQFTNNLGEQISRRTGAISREAGRVGMSAAGGAVGSKLAGGTLRGGAFAGVKRNLKRGTGFVANAARENDNVKNQNLRNLQNQNSRAKEMSNKADQQQLTNALNNGGFAHSNGVPMRDKSGNFVRTPQTNRATGAQADRLYKDRDASQRGLDDLTKSRDNKLAENNVINGENASRVKQMEDAVDYIDNEGNVAHANVMADKEFVQSIANEIKKVRPELSDEEALEVAGELLEIKGNIEMSKAGRAGYEGLMQAESVSDRFRNGDTEYYNSLKDNSQIYAGNVKANEARLNTEFADLANIPGLDSAHGQYAPLSPEAKESLAAAENSSIYSADSGLSKEQIGKYDSLKSLKEQEEKLNADYAMAYEAGDDRAMSDIESRKNDIAGQIGRMNTEIQTNDPALSEKVNELQNLEAQERQDNSYEQVASLASANSAAIISSTKTRDNNEQLINSAEEQISEKQQEVSGYNSQIDRLKVEQGIDPKAPEAMPMSPQERIKNDNSEYTGGQQYDTNYSDNNDYNSYEAPVSTSRYNESVINERTKMELEQNEKMSEGLHPGEGLSRRQIRKQREDLAKKMEAEGFINEDEAKTYGRVQSRRDVRGQGLDYGQDSYGYNEQVNRDVLPPQPNNGGGHNGNDEPPRYDPPTPPPPPTPTPPRQQDRESSSQFRQPEPELHQEQPKPAPRQEQPKPAQYQEQPETNRESEIQRKESQPRKEPNSGGYDNNSSSMSFNDAPSFNDNASESPAPTPAPPRAQDRGDSSHIRQPEPEPRQEQPRTAQRQEQPKPKRESRTQKRQSQPRKQPNSGGYDNNSSPMSFDDAPSFNDSAHESPTPPKQNKIPKQPPRMNKPKQQNPTQNRLPKFGRNNSGRSDK